MKAVILFTLLACAVVTFSQIPYCPYSPPSTPSSPSASYRYIFPSAPCSWSVTAECESRNQYSKIEFNVFGLYNSYKVYNKNDDLIYASVSRPDYTVRDYDDSYGNVMSFKYDGLTCENEIGTATAKDYSVLFGFLSSNNGYYQLLEEDEYNGKDCRVYYNSIFDYDLCKWMPNKNNTVPVYPGQPTIPLEYISYYVPPVLYVDSDGYIIGTVLDAFGQYRSVCNYTYGTYVTMSDFTFSKREVYGCPDERIYSTPKAYYGHCSASTVGAAITVVVAAVVAAMVSLF